MEYIAQRIQSYTLSGRLGERPWQELARGQCVGHKRIEQFPLSEISAVRLQVNQSKAAPILRRFAAYADA